MMLHRSKHSALPWAILLLLGAAPSAFSQTTKTPQVSFTTIPHIGPGGSKPTEHIAGKVTGIDAAKFQDYKIVVYAYTDAWYVQPTADHPLTRIDINGGLWEAETHLGSRYAAVLVKVPYQPAPKTTAIPNPEGKEVITITTAAGERAE
jgi:hypothetical protein